jgi:hypothetical protein
LLTPLSGVNNMKLLAILATLLTATAVAAPAHDVEPRDLYKNDAPQAWDGNFIDAVMRAHWYWRRVHCAQDLVWDQGLADIARNDISTCTQKPQHVSRAFPSFSLSSAKS